MNFAISNDEKVLVIMSEIALCLLTEDVGNQRQTTEGAIYSIA